MDQLAEALAAGQNDADEQYSVALERWLALGGPDLAERTESMLADLGLVVDPGMPMTGLSGGQGARV